VFRYGASALRADEDGVARIRADPTLTVRRRASAGCDPTNRLKTTASHAARCSDVARRFPVIAFVTCGSVVPTTSLLSLCFPISPDGAPAPRRGVGRRPVSSEFAAASWLFSSRRQALTLLEHCTASVARPNVEVRRDQRQDARPGLVKMYAYHQTGPGGLPLGLASTEGLGLTRQPSRPASLGPQYARTQR